MSYTTASNRCKTATYLVNHADGTTAVPVDQTVRGTPDVRGGEWVSLGTFTFPAGITSTVELTDTPTGYVVADAVRFFAAEA